MWLAYVVCSLVYLTTTLQLPSNYLTTDLTALLTYQMKTMYIVIFVMLFAMLSAMLYLNIVF